ncbi:hypothetical protein J5X84_26025 [Streptosporangiaceae bacterium NEAU-GS5]|nr:hypothetical protein [Streptosporangiaceae bacterium NEAU-GS5]
MQKTRLTGRPLSVWYFVVLAAASVVGLYGATTYVSYYETDFIAYPCWALLALYWVGRLGDAVTRAGLPVVRQHLARWLIPPLTILALVVFLGEKGPAWVRFSLSESALRSYATQLASGAEPDDPCGWHGLYYICETEVLEGGGVLLVSSDMGLMARMGFAWIPGLAPGDTPADDALDNQYFYFTGHWWGYKGWDGL